MIAPVTTIAKNTLIESVRQPVFLVLILTAGLLQVLNTWITGFSMGYRRVPGEVTGDDKLLLDVGLSTVFVCGMLLAAFIATSAISREIENKTILTVVSKPISRTQVILGKYLGISGALSIAVYLMLLALLLGLRHGVLSTAADDPDQPVIIFSFIALFGSLFIAAITNYMYGWQFGQTMIAVLVPSLTIAYLGVMLINEDWKFQPIATDFKPQIMLASGGTAVALMVLAAVATAASTRLGQVMTITACAGVFVLGLLSNHLFGQYAYINTPIAEFKEVTPGTVLSDSFSEMGSTYKVGVLRAYTAELEVGDVLYWGTAPNGVGMSVPNYSPGFDVSTISLEDTRWPIGTPSAIVVTEISDLEFTLKNVGNPPVQVRVPPEPGNFMFEGPTQTNPVAQAVWGVVPNMHTFWMIDAVSQARDIPLKHMGLVLLYGLSQIVGLLAIAVLLFQSRDVG